MYEAAVLAATVLVWLIGQAMVAMSFTSAGIAVIIFSVLAGSFFFTRAWRIFSEKGFAGSGKATAVFAFFASVLAVIASLLSKTSSSDSVILFVVSGALLFLARPEGKSFFAFFELPDERRDMAKWEPVFVFGLLLISGFIRLFDTGNLHPVGTGGEGLILGNCYYLAAKGSAYTPHVGGGTDWPTLTYYIGIIFAKMLGWDIANLRMSSGLLGTLSIIAFYFLARRITSPFSAALASLMYTVFMPHLCMSRQFVGPLTILFLPHIVSLGIILAARDMKKWYLYLAAGLALGYSLHGYVPGRGVFVIFIVWFLFMAMTGKTIFRKASNMVIFWGGFLLIASPVIYFALKYPQQYWGYVNSVNPNKTGGIKQYFTQLVNSVPLYAGMFYTKSAWDIVMHFPYEPLFDRVTGAVFGAGFFMCVFAFWKPLPSLLLAMFIAGMMPAMLGGGSTIPPNAQRALLTYPVIFLICAYAFERIKQAFGNSWKPVRYAVSVLSIVAAVWVFHNGFTQYFVKFVKSPATRNNAGYHLYLMGKEIKKHIKAETHVTPFFVGNDTFLIYVPPGKRLDVQPYLHEMLCLKKDSDHLILLCPFYINSLDIFRESFPDAVITTYREDPKYINDKYYTDFVIHQGGRRHIDDFVPYVFMHSVYVPMSNVVDFQSCMLEGDAGQGKRVRTFNGSGFGTANKGKKMKLSGAVILPEESYFSNDNKPVTFEMGWKGWSLVLDGKMVPFGKCLKVEGGVHFFTLSGTVPENGSGDLPLLVSYGDRDLSKEGRLVALAKPLGAVLESVRGQNNWDKPAENTHRVLVSNLRLYDGVFMHLPFSLKEKAFLKVPESGEYEITGNGNNRSKILVNGVTVFDNLDDPARPQITPIKLYKGEKARVEIRANIEYTPSYLRALTLYIKGPGMREKILAPAEWLEPEN